MDWTYHSPAFLCGLIALGLGVGFLTGLFGVGGGFIATPIMITLLGVDSSIAVGSSLGFTLGASAFGVRRHLRAGNLASRTAMLVGGGATLGTVLGYLLHNRLAQYAGEHFDDVMSLAFIVLLSVIAILIASTTERVKNPKSLMVKLRWPPYISIRKIGGAQVSIIGLIGAGFPVGLLGGLFGIGGGIILIPILTLVIGLTPHVAVGTSLAAVLLSSIVGCSLYAFGSQAVDLGIIASLILGSLVGTMLGARLCNRLHAEHLHRLFAVVVGLTAIFLLLDLQFRPRGQSHSMPQVVPAGAVDMRPGALRSALRSALKIGLREPFVPHSYATSANLNGTAMFRSTLPQQTSAGRIFSASHQCPTGNRRLIPTSE